MKHTPLRTRSIITGSDRRTGRFLPGSSATITEDASLWKAERLAAAHATRHSLHRAPRPGVIHRLASAGKSFLMAVGIL